MKNPNNKDKVKETYETANWIFRELITLKEFKEVIKQHSTTKAEQEKEIRILKKDRFHILTKYRKEISELKERERAFGFVELDNLDIHFKGMSKEEQIKVLHFNYKLEQEFKNQKKGTIVDLEQELRQLKEKNKLIERLKNG